jgi:hypothetical protein
MGLAMRYQQLEAPPSLCASPGIALGLSPRLSKALGFKNPEKAQKGRKAKNVM